MSQPLQRHSAIGPLHAGSKSAMSHHVAHVSHHNSTMMTCSSSPFSQQARACLLLADKQIVSTHWAASCQCFVFGGSVSIAVCQPKVSLQTVPAQHLLETEVLLREASLSFRGPEPPVLEPAPPQKSALSSWHQFYALGLSRGLTTL